MTTLLQPVHTMPVREIADSAPGTAFESRAVTRVRSLGDLMVRRPDLYGVYKPADVATEAILWSA